ncbi:hypothetical protein INR49_020660 [Caranx melampygus]|nr:hypothetical protein INR49_020660 [Caranx melampygus]
MATPCRAVIARRLSSVCSPARCPPPPAAAAAAAPLARYVCRSRKMSEEDEGVQRARAGFEDLCRALNMDEEASTEAWRTYENISRNFTLEGSELHWLACALYVACRSAVPTVGKGTVEGNFVSLTRILRCSEMSLIEFFSKMKKWQDMAELPNDFRQSTEKLERNFTVTAVIFKKYVPIFKAIFRRRPRSPPSSPQPQTEASPLHCPRGLQLLLGPVQLHLVPLMTFDPQSSEAGWCVSIMYLHGPPGVSSGNFPMISDDLVNSYHLLLCALDLVFTNALLCHARKELLNPDFTGLPEDFSSKDFRPSSGPHCFIQQLCELHEGLVLEAKGVKEHFWKPFIKKLFHKRILRGKEDSLTGFLDPMNFGDSFRVYEEHVLATGSLDERIFTAALHPNGEKQPVVVFLLSACERDVMDVALLRQASALKVSTPLTGRKYVQDNSLSSPVSSAMKSVGRLHTLLSGTKQGPSPKLAETLRACARDPSDVISQRLRDMFDVFSQHHERVGAERRGMGKGDFPNVITVFQLPAYHFYKVIEVLVRSEQSLFREVVKHLNQVEEQVLESLAWTRDSPLWESLRGAKDQVPTCQEVMPPQYLEQNDDSSTGSTNTPVTHGPELSTNSTIKGVSPSPTMLLDRYTSSPTGSARRRLFVDPVDGEGGVTSTSTSTSTTPTKTRQASLVTAIPAGQTVVTMATATVTANNGQTVTIPVQGIANESGGITFIPVQVSVTGQGGATLQPLSAQTLTGTLTVQSAASKPAAKPAGSPLRKGSLSLFFRKVHLSTCPPVSYVSSLHLSHVSTCLTFNI